MPLFRLTAHSLFLSHPFPHFVTVSYPRAVFGSSFSRAGLGSSCPIVVICSRPVIRLALTRPARRLVPSTSGAWRSHPHRVVRSLWGKQAGRRGDAIRSLRLAGASRGERLVPHSLCSSRRAARVAGSRAGRVSWRADGVSKQAGSVSPPSSRLCPLGEHQFDIRIPRGSHHPPGSPCLSSVNWRARAGSSRRLVSPGRLVLRLPSRAVFVSSSVSFFVSSAHPLGAVFLTHFVRPSPLSSCGSP